MPCAVCPPYPVCGGMAYRPGMGWSWFRRRKRILGDAEESVLVDAIRRAEAGHRGEVRVHVERTSKGLHPLSRAAHLFEGLGMRHTTKDTGVLLYVAVEDRQVAVYAGRGVHGAALPGFWQEVATSVAQGFREDASLPALVTAVERIGALLRQAAPGADVAGNELPDAVSQS
ncbi:TPM domain-containing protein [Corallococcus praedator]|uniref:TPM domain-containing protein n=2 Tax=Myxococcaceae TaxID=31 RepID=A0ABX9QH50_9BACT|nr:TPM domain-containing protein [Corallococcus sp. CA031C]RKI07038.1 TPM domain-containing protein [Corallococcus praedator]